MMSEITDIPEVTVTQRLGEKDFSDSSGAAVRICTVTTQKFGKAGITRELTLKATYKDKKKQNAEEVCVSRSLTLEETKQFGEAADRLAGVAETWRSAPSTNRTYIEFLTPVVDGISIGRRSATDGKNEYFVQVNEGTNEVRCALGEGTAQLSEFCYAVQQAGIYLT